MKTRYNKPFETVQVKIPYATGMTLHSGMTELLENQGLLVKDGNRLSYVMTDGNEIKAYRRAYETNENNLWDAIIQDLTQNPERMTTKIVQKGESDAD